MKVVLHDRTVGLGPQLREHAQSKLTRLVRHFGKVAEAEVEFTEERRRSGLTTSLCRINVHLDGRRTPTLSAHESGSDAQSALDLALDKIDRQVLKLKEKRTHRKQPVSSVRVPPDERAGGRSAEPDRVRVKLHPMSIEQALDELESDSQAFVVFMDEDTGSIQIAYRREDGSTAILEPIVT